MLESYNQSLLIGRDIYMQIIRVLSCQLVRLSSLLFELIGLWLEYDWIGQSDLISKRNYSRMVMHFQKYYRNLYQGQFQEEPQQPVLFIEVDEPSQGVICVKRSTILKWGPQNWVHMVSVVNLLFQAMEHLYLTNYLHLLHYMLFGGQSNPLPPPPLFPLGEVTGLSLAVSELNRYFSPTHHSVNLIRLRLIYLRMIRPTTVRLWWHGHITQARQL